MFDRGCDFFLLFTSFPKKGQGGDHERRTVFSLIWVEGQGGFALKNWKTSEYLGCINRAGQVVCHHFPHSKNRSRELIWQREEQEDGTFLLKNRSFDQYIGPVETSKPKNLGLLVMVDEAEHAQRFFMENVKVQWSFINEGKALTSLNDGQLGLQNKGMFGWSAYFELEKSALNDSMFIRPCKNEKYQYLSIDEKKNHRCRLSKTSAYWMLVPSLKRGSFYLKHVDSKRFISAPDSSGMMQTTDTVNNAMIWTLSDVKGESFSGQLVGNPVSDAWKTLEEGFRKRTKYAVAHPVYSHLPSVFEREMSDFASMFFVSRCNDFEATNALVAKVRGNLTSFEKVLLSNCENAFNLIPAIMSKESQLFRALDKAVSDAKQAVSLSEKLFAKYSEIDPPHIFNMGIHEEDSIIRVACVGDYGTGKPKARQLLNALFKDEDCRPNVFIHLGDVYKKGTKREQLENFVQPLHDAIKANPGAPVRVFDLPGNHDYISKGGEGYYWALEELSRRHLSQQTCSFFCLNIGKKFTFIGLDTSLDCLKYDSDALETRLNDEQLEWLKHRMEESKGRKIIFLSHHPLLACGPASFGSINKFLWSQLSPYFSDTAAYFWAHEHCFRYPFSS